MLTFLLKKLYKIKRTAEALHIELTVKELKKV